MRIGGTALYFADIQTIQQIPRLSEHIRQSGLPVWILGEGSNTVFEECLHEQTVVHMGIKGIEILSQSRERVLIGAYAGEHWDDVVAWSIARDLHGIEALSGIPGSVGAGPVQNIGAYGQELSDTLQSVDVYDLHKQQFKSLSKRQCALGYRTSTFQTKATGRYIILRVVMSLARKQSATIPDYPGVRDALHQKGIKNPTLVDIRDVIRFIRDQKIPPPEQTPNMGSFFKNPQVTQATIAHIKKRYPKIPTFPGEQNKKTTKIPAGWILETLGFKGSSFGNLVVSEKNALVLTNPKKTASFYELVSFRDHVIHTVNDTFGITLEAEPRIVQAKKDPSLPVILVPDDTYAKSLISLWDHVTKDIQTYRLVLVSEIKDIDPSIPVHGIVSVPHTDRSRKPRHEITRLKQKILKQFPRCHWVLASYGDKQNWESHPRMYTYGHAKADIAFTMEPQSLLQTRIHLPNETFLFSSATDDEASLLGALYGLLGLMNIPTKTIRRLATTHAIPEFIPVSRNKKGAHLVTLPHESIDALRHNLACFHKRIGKRDRMLLIFSFDEKISVDELKHTAQLASEYSHHTIVTTRTHQPKELATFLNHMLQALPVHQKILSLFPVFSQSVKQIIPNLQKQDVCVVIGVPREITLRLHQKFLET